MRVGNNQRAILLRMVRWPIELAEGLLLLLTRRLSFRNIIKRSRITLWAPSPRRNLEAATSDERGPQGVRTLAWIAGREVHRIVRRMHSFNAVLLVQALLDLSQARLALSCRGRCPGIGIGMGAKGKRAQPATTSNGGGAVPASAAATGPVPVCKAASLKEAEGLFKKFKQKRCACRCTKFLMYVHVAFQLCCQVLHSYPITCLQRCQAGATTAGGCGGIALCCRPHHAGQGNGAAGGCCTREGQLPPGRRMQPSGSRLPYMRRVACWLAFKAVRRYMSLGP